MAKLADAAFCQVGVWTQFGHRAPGAVQVAKANNVN